MNGNSTIYSYLVWRGRRCKLEETKSRTISEAVDKHADMVRRICFLYLRNYADVEDVFQEVFLKFMLYSKNLSNENHEKAWLCRVTYNQCKDLLKSTWRKKVISIEEMDIPYQDDELNDFLSLIHQLPPHYRQVLYLHFYEKMTIPEIASSLKKNTNTVYTHLNRAKKLLKASLKEEYCNG
ncbi:MAG TPA: RNA polymerase subunit sigma-24 [Ruminococcaceae bacterium]|jgi:RNA polymerase sigma-70 factor (ECF subfamily)|nr:RNA polymerase subunit sigma-24 [Oscillospiraceae bacterium]